MDSSHRPLCKIPRSTAEKSLLKNQTVSVPHLLKPSTQVLYKNYDFTTPNITNFLSYHPKTSKILAWDQECCGVKALPLELPRKIRKIAQILQDQASLSKLELIFNEKTSFQHSFLLSQVRYLSSLQILSIDFDLSHHKAFEALAVSLCYLKNLTTLNISFCSLEFVQPKSFHQFLRGIKTLRKLTHLSLKFAFSKNLKDSHIDLLRSHLCKLTQLHSLTLNLHNAKHLTNHSIRSLALALPKLSLLKKIHLVLPEFINTTIFQFFSSFQALKNLTDITLNLRYSQILPKSSLSEGLLTLDPSRIQRLNLYLPKNFDDPALLNLAQAIPRYSSLTALSLTFSFCDHLTTQSLSDSIFQLQTLSSLTSLSLNFSFLYNISSTVASVTSALKSLIGLENLTLDFKYHERIQDEEIVLLSACLTNLTSLKYLDINLDGAELLTNHSIEALARSLKQLCSLKSLALNLGFMKLVENKGVQTLAEALKRMKNLVFLALEFDESDIDHNGLDQLAEAIECLPRLAKIHLSFFSCLQLAGADEMSKDLSRALRNSKSIQQIDLFLRRSEWTMNEIQQISKRRRIKVSFE